jgi:DNA primase
VGIVIPQSFIEDLNAKVDLVNLIGKYVTLKPRGKDYWACCPFHSEDTPSFTVSPNKGFYHCFGCGEHGNALKFVMEHAGMGFIDGVKFLAELTGMSVPDQGPQASQVDARQKAGAYAALRDAVELYQHLLGKNDRAIAYLHSRGVDEDTIAKYQLGYASEAWNTVANSYRFKKQSVVDAGLVIEGDNSKRYDRFRDRIMFPIANRRGEVIGFGGRVIDKGDPKYLNSPETIVFHKGCELYGLYQAQTAIRIHNHALVVEGYLDVAMLSQCGIQNAVAPLGTAITVEQIQKLLKIAERVTFCFDGDLAGHRAAWKAAVLAAPLVADDQLVDFVFLPDNHDPDSFVREKGREAYLLCLENAIPLTKFVLDKLQSIVNFDTDEGKAKFISLAYPIAKSITAPALGILFRKRIKQMTGLDDLELQAVYQEDPITPNLPSMAGKICLILLSAPWLASQLDSEHQLGSLKADENWPMLEDVLAALQSKPDMSENAICELGMGKVYEYRLLRLIQDAKKVGEEFDAPKELLRLLQTIAAQVAA